MTNKFINAIYRQNNSRPPVWFMRQAGRYHSHYQKIRAQNSFIDLCKKPDLATHVTFGPIEDFNFDAAILFSDLLFPLESMGMGLSYNEGPELSWHLKNNSDLSRLRDGNPNDMAFQYQALNQIRSKLSSEKGLIGFVGGPITLFYYAVEGSHKGDLSSARAGLIDGRYQEFVKKLVPLLTQNMIQQAQAGADAVALFDTCAGELDPDTYQKIAVPTLSEVMKLFKERCPNTPLIYYSKNTTPRHWSSLIGLPFQCLGIDWNHSLYDTLSYWTQHWSIQGNVDPHWLFLETDVLKAKLKDLFLSIRQLPQSVRAGWICGLGHGVLPKTPEKNVRAFIDLQREIFES